MKLEKAITDAIPVVIGIVVMMLGISVSYEFDLSGAMLIAFIVLTTLAAISSFALLAWLLWRTK